MENNFSHLIGAIQTYWLVADSSLIYLELVSISLGISIISYGIGSIIKTVFGIDI